MSTAETSCPECKNQSNVDENMPGSKVPSPECGTAAPPPVEEKNIPGGSEGKLKLSELDFNEVKGLYNASKNIIGLGILILMIAALGGFIFWVLVKHVLPGLTEPDNFIGILFEMVLIIITVIIIPLLFAIIPTIVFPVITAFKARTNFARWAIGLMAVNLILAAVFLIIDNIHNIFCVIINILLAVFGVLILRDITQKKRLFGKEHFTHRQLRFAYKKLKKRQTFTEEEVPIPRRLSAVAANIISAISILISIAVTIIIIISFNVKLFPQKSENTEQIPESSSVSDHQKTLDKSHKSATSGDAESRLKKDGKE